MRRAKPMCRLLQGDVGSGKTTVAAASMLLAAGNGIQSALMVPTETLAIQHYSKLSKTFDSMNVRSALLTGSTSGAERSRILYGSRRRDPYPRRHSCVVFPGRLL
jgi:ATP-dependent DNA helicase RecG